MKNVYESCDTAAAANVYTGLQTLHSAAERKAMKYRAEDVAVCLQAFLTSALGGSECQVHVLASLSSKKED